MSARRVCDACGGIVGPWLECDVDDPDARDCICYDEIAKRTPRVKGEER